jgi:hypothetical protein
MKRLRSITNAPREPLSGILSVLVFQRCFWKVTVHAAADRVDLLRCAAGVHLVEGLIADDGRGAPVGRRVDAWDHGCYA